MHSIHWYAISRIEFSLFSRPLYSQTLCEDNGLWTFFSSKMRSARTEDRICRATENKFLNFVCEAAFGWWAKLGEEHVCRYHYFIGHWWYYTLHIKSIVISWFIHYGVDSSLCQLLCWPLQLCSVSVCVGSTRWRFHLHDYIRVSGTLQGCASNKCLRQQNRMFWRCEKKRREKSMARDKAIKFFFRSASFS